MTPVGHHNWTKLTPTAQNEGRWAIQSMLWVHKDLEVFQVAVESADITAAVLRLPDQSILISSVYVPPADPMALLQTLQLLRLLIENTCHQIGTQLDIVVAGDFNQHDQLWGGYNVSQSRQGEANPLVNFLADYSLCCLLIVP